MKNIGDRVYIKEKVFFGDVTRLNILGFKKSQSPAILRDDGVAVFYTGESERNETVELTTGLDGNDNEYIIPVDVKTVGYSVLPEVGISDSDTKLALFQKFSALSEAERIEEAEQWEQNYTDETNRQLFLEHILEILSSDDNFIIRQSELLLKHISQDIKDQMLLKFQELSTSESRQNFIVSYTNIKNDKRKTEDFLQSMYSMLIDDEIYIKLELERFASRYYVEPLLSEKIELFFSNTTLEERGVITSQWRASRYYNSKKGSLFAKKILDRYST